MYSPVSNYVEGVDLAFKIIFGIGFFFLIGITALMIWFVIRYSRKRHPKAEQVKDNNLLEIVWTTIPMIIVMVMFYYGYIAYKPMRNAPKNAIVIKTTGKMWVWSFEYEGKKESASLVVPLNKAVRLNLYSPDVIHGLYIPAFRIKEDVVPGKDNYVWFIAGQLGEYEILCSAFCGVRHSYMEAKLKVVTEEEYNKWLKDLPATSTEPEGLSLIKKNACTGCHSLDGTMLVSTSFKGLYGKQRTVVTSGKERMLSADDEYIKRSMYDPDADVVKGLNKGIMKPYKGLITDEEVSKIIDYLKALK